MLQKFVIKIFFPDLHINNLDLNSTGVFSEIISVYQLNPQYVLFKKIVFFKVEADVIKRFR